MSPKLMIWLSVILSAVAQIFLKQGLSSLQKSRAGADPGSIILGVVREAYVWLWGMCFVLATALWLLGLQKLDLSMRTRWSHSGTCWLIFFRHSSSARESIAADGSRSPSSAWASCSSPAADNMISVPDQSKMRVAVLGGGITGLTAAFYLLRAGAEVTVLEGRSQLGGLATYFNFGEFCWDKFYHCILTSDGPLLQLIDDLGLTSKLKWTPTKVGFFADEKLYSMSSSLDFLRFRPLSLWQKTRLAAGILYACRIKEPDSLEGELASEWLTRVFGKKNYQKMWGPLLKCKLGTCRELASAAFIWATITRLYSTRDKSSRQQERLGYVQGGYRTVFERLVQVVEGMGGRILTDAPVSGSRRQAEGLS